jgi:hypothetical protein
LEIFKALLIILVERSPCGKGDPDGPTGTVAPGPEQVVPLEWGI